MKKKLFRCAATELDCCPERAHPARTGAAARMSGRPGRCGPVSIVLLFLITVTGLAQEKKHPVYVGARVCGSCHDGLAMGNQYSKWLLTRHARAYASLSKPEAWQIAKLSGVPEPPHRAMLCLGCHATAAEAEPWERDPTFAIEDGMQCEKCHGPGSEYATAEVMMNREAALKAGLKMPTKEWCAKCHYVKGSHVAVHKLPQLDLDEAMKTIAHPLPDKPVLSSHKVEKPAAARSTSGPKYVGSLACGSCHKQQEMGFQYSAWRMSSHARAHAVLSTPEGYAQAKKRGIEGDPQHSGECLKCHTTGHGADPSAFASSFNPAEGVGCEACHGPGSEYLAEAIMRDKRTAEGQGLRPVSRDTCLRCHQDSAEKPFNYEEAKKKIAHPTRLPALAEEPRYKTPVNAAVRPDGKEIYVACEAGNSVIVIDTSGQEKVAEIPVGGQPADVTFSPDGRIAYVSNRLDDNVSVIDVANRKVVRTLAAGDEPHGLLTDRTGRYLFVLNTATDDISVYDTKTYSEMKRLSASRSPWSLALSPDGRTILVTNTLSRFVKLRTPSMSEITVIDAERAVVKDRLTVKEANLVQGVSWHPSGEFGFITLNRTKNLVPMSQLIQGWTITNGLGIVWKEGSRIDQVLLDEPNLGFSDAADVVFTPDGKYGLVTSSTSHRVAVVAVEKLLAIVRSASEKEKEEILPNHRGKSTEFIVKHIATERSPRGVLMAPDGKYAYTCNSLDDSLTVIDLTELKATKRIDLGGPKVITKTRFGEQVFNDSSISFQHQFACHSCHPDGHVDGLNYDIEADGIGISPVDNRTLRGINDTDPFKWEGTNPSLSRQCGARLAVFFTRGAPFTPEQLAAVDNYICTIPRPPNRYRPLGAPLTPAQRRGKIIFERTTTNDGREIPLNGRCVTCHFPPLYTDRARHDVGTQERLDRTGSFDVPHLNNIYDSAPYLHNGMAATLEEIWTVHNPYDKHGVTNDMTKDQLNDLIEYIKTL
ncbi:MAG: multiheme c-type cytochrome [Acidobacteriota bacterium]